MIKHFYDKFVSEEEATFLDIAMQVQVTTQCKHGHSAKFTIAYCTCIYSSNILQAQRDSAMFQYVQAACLPGRLLLFGCHDLLGGFKSFRGTCTRVMKIEVYDTCRELCSVRRFLAGR